MDTIIKRFFIVTILFVGLINNLVIGQVFNLKSLEGKEKTINLSPNYENGILTIFCAKDTLNISGLTDIKTVKVLNENFLLVSYSIRGGSGIDLRRSLILSIKDDVICQSLHITSLFSEEFIDFRKPSTSSNEFDKRSLFKVGFSLKGNDIRNYNLDITVHDEKKSKDAIQNNYEHDNEVFLHFDISKKIFFTKYEDISQYFIVFDPKSQRETKLYIVGNFPMIRLGSYKYYYIKEEWYEKDEDNSLTKYSYK